MLSTGPILVIFPANGKGNPMIAVQKSRQPNCEDLKRTKDVIKNIDTARSNANNNSFGLKPNMHSKNRNNERCCQAKPS